MRYELSDFEWIAIKPMLPAKRPTQGIVTVRTTGRKADGTVSMTFERTVLVPKRDHAVDDVAGH